MSRTPGDAGLGPEARLRVVQPGRVSRREAADRDISVVIVERGEEPGEGGERIRDDATPHPRVHGVVEGAHLDDTLRESAQRRGEGGGPDVPVRRVGDDHDVAGKLVAVGLEQERKGRRSRLLLPFHEHGDPDGNLCTVGSDRCQMGCDTRLVVCRPAPEEPAVSLRRLEGC